MKPKAISYSALSSFENCGFQYYNRYLLKKFKDGEKSDKQDWGDEVHKQFDARMSIKTPLTDGLAEHETYMQKLDRYAGGDGVVFTEIKGALNTKLECIDFMSTDAFMRVIIDFVSVVRRGDALLTVDYKSGKEREGMERQLMMDAIYLWRLFPQVNIVDARFYYTSTKIERRHVWSRDQEPELWEVLLPTISQFKHAYATDTWPKRKSGLCRGWCEVQDCPNWEPKR